MATVFLVGGATDRRGAAAVAACLGRLAPSYDVVLAAPAELAASRWTHEVGSDGSARTTVVLPRGRVVEFARVGAAYVGAEALPPLAFTGAGPREVAYAAAEWQALWASALAGLGARVLGPVGGEGPGSARSWAGWARVAQRHGLDTIADGTVAVDPLPVVVAGERVVADEAPGRVPPVVPPETAARLIRMAAGNGGLLGLVVDRLSWAVAAVNATPAVGSAGVEAIAQELLARAGQDERRVA